LTEPIVSPAPFVVSSVMSAVTVPGVADNDPER
jgi:hypothetical protein